MHRIKHSVGAVIAADTQQSVTALDLAVITQSRMCASVVEAATQARLPMAATQSLLVSLSSGIHALIESRAGLAEAVRELTLIQARSSLREVSFGCPLGGEDPHEGDTFFTSGSAGSRIDLAA